MIDRVFFGADGGEKDAQPGGGERRARRATSRRSAALGVTIMVHASLFAAFIGLSDQAQAVLPENDGGQGMLVSLVGSAHGQPRQAAPETPLSQLQQRLQVRSAPTTPTQAQPGAAAPDVLQELDRQARPNPGSSSQATHGSNKGLSDKGVPHVGQDPWALASLSVQNLPPSTQTDLWPQVASCWRPPKGHSNVRLQVILNDRGMVAAPPTPVGAAQAQTLADRAAAETAARRAISACGPYAIAAGAPRTYELEFRAD